MPKEKDKARIMFARGSRRLARILDDSKERKVIRDKTALQMAIEEGTQLNQFESLVANGYLPIYILPREARGTKVGEEVWLNSGHRAYYAYINSSRNHISVSVDTTHERKPAGTTFEIVHSGKVGRITFRNPEERVLFKSTSSIISFSVLKPTEKKRKYSYYVAFINPDSVSVEE